MRFASVHERHKADEERLLATDFTEYTDKERDKGAKAQRHKGRETQEKIQIIGS